jgi:hypothetical protein
MRTEPTTMQQYVRGSAGLCGLSAAARSSLWLCVGSTDGKFADRLDKEAPRLAAAATGNGCCGVPMQMQWSRVRRLLPLLTSPALSFRAATATPPHPGHSNWRPTRALEWVFWVAGKICRELESGGLHQRLPR